MAQTKKQGQAPKQADRKLDVQRRGEDDFAYSARRSEELSSDGANSTYEPGPVPNLVQQFRGKPKRRG